MRRLHHASPLINRSKTRSSRFGGDGVDVFEQRRRHNRAALEKRLLKIAHKGVFVRALTMGGAQKRSGEQILSQQRLTIEGSAGSIDEGVNEEIGIRLVQCGAHVLEHPGRASTS